MAYTRNLKKEAEWAKNVYKKYEFRARRDNGDVEKVEKILNGRSFSAWVRGKIEEELSNNHTEE